MDKFTDIMENENVTLAELLEGLAEERQELFNEQYGL